MRAVLQDGANIARMVAYLIRRLIQAIVVVLGVVLVVFALSRAIPGGEARAALGPTATREAIEQFNRIHGLTAPIWNQLWRYLVGLVHLTLGYSYQRTEPVWDLIKARLPKTLVLVGAALFLQLLVAIPLGVFQVVKYRRPMDHLLSGASFVAYAMPTFFLGTLLIIWLSFDLRILPAAAPYNAPPWAVFTDPRAFVMPVATLAATGLASYSRYTRASMLDAFAEDYIRTARAKGASERRVLYRHALRNALIPVVTLVGLTLATIVSGVVIVESIFNYPGMGLLAVQGAYNHTFPVVLGTTLIVSVATVAGSLFADLLYLVVDPRVRYVS